MHRLRSLAVSAAFALALPLGGCGGLTMTKLASVQSKPSNVGVFVAVERGGQPVAGLAADDFAIYEDGLLVSKADSKLVLLSPDASSVGYTLLLVDMSSSGTAAVSTNVLVGGVGSFLDQVGKTQKVGVYAFDGEPTLHPIAPFGAAKQTADGLSTYKAKDASSNLNGAIVAALRELAKAAEQERKPLRFTTLVVLAGGADRAGRVTHDDVLKELKDAKYGRTEVFTIGLGPDAAQAQLGDVGKTSSVSVGASLTFLSALDQAATTITAHGKRYYLLSYCTPARKGEHKVRIEARAKEPDATGSFEYTLKADGFGTPPECDPNTVPAFAGMDALPVPPPPETKPAESSSPSFLSSLPIPGLGGAEVPGVPKGLEVPGVGKGLEVPGVGKGLDVPGVGKLDMKAVEEAAKKKAEPPKKIELPKPEPKKGK